MYVKIINNQVSIFPYNMDNLRRENPTVSFPAIVPESTLVKYGVYLVSYQNNPTYNFKTQKVIASDIPVLIDNKWTITRSVIDLTDEEIEENTIKQSEIVREQRNILLIETDYHALSDNTMSDEITVYRQALRDITSQTGFPYSVEWPIKP
jgi:hypothetical protein